MESQVMDSGATAPDGALDAGAAPAPPPPAEEVIAPTSELMRRVEAESGVEVGACYGCKKCSNGCPVTFAMDYHPYEVVRYVQLGQEERLRSSRTIWVCASCQTCLTRCPNEVDLPRLMDYLKETVATGGGQPALDRVMLFHRLFIDNLLARGRVFEGSLMAGFILKTGGALGPEAMANAKLGWTMLRKGRMKLVPARVQDRRWLGALKAARKGGA